MAKPCGAPASIVKLSDSVLLHLTLAIRSCRKFEIQRMRFMGKLSWVSFSLSPSCHIVSNAFRTSRAAITAAKLLF